MAHEGESVPLREYFEALMKEEELRHQQRFEAMEKAIQKAEEAINQRINLLNELRADVLKKGDFAASEQRINDLHERLDRRDGIEGKLQLWQILVGVAAMAAGVVVILAFIISRGVPS